MKYMESHSAPLVITSGKASTSCRYTLLHTAGRILCAVKIIGKHQATANAMLNAKTATFLILCFPAPTAVNINTRSSISATARKPVLEAVNSR